MDGMSGLVSWTDTQWKRVRQAVTEEANRVRVASSFLPSYGPLPPSTQVVPSEVVNEAELTVDDVATTRLVELWVDIELSQQQIAEDELSSALLLFRRAANIVARGEDRTVFQGRPNAPGAGNRPPDFHVGPNQGVPVALQIRGGTEPGDIDLNTDPGAAGLLEAVDEDAALDLVIASPLGPDELVVSIVTAITALEDIGHLAPFYCVLGNDAFVAAQTPIANSLVLPSDRITPFLGRAILRSGTIPDTHGVVISLAGDPVDLAVAVDVVPQFLNVTDAGRYHFRVFERFALRVKERHAIARLEFG
jgi:uncharacterized linocin/CFP29 family protein